VTVNEGTELHPLHLKKKKRKKERKKTKKKNRWVCEPSIPITGRRCTLGSLHTLLPPPPPSGPGAPSPWLLRPARQPGPASHAGRSGPPRSGSAPPNKGPANLGAQRRRRAHLGSVPGGGSAGLRRRGPDGGQGAGSRPGASGALGRRGPAQRRRSGLGSRRRRRQRQRQRRRGRVGGDAFRQVQVQRRRRRDAPSSLSPAGRDSGAARVRGSGGGSSGDYGRAGRGAALLPPPPAPARAVLRERGGKETTCHGAAGTARWHSRLSGSAAGGGGCGSRGHRAEVRSCHRGHLVALTDKNPPLPPLQPDRALAPPSPPRVGLQQEVVPAPGT
jgi:hypothetical protein